MAETVSTAGAENTNPSTAEKVTTETAGAENTNPATDNNLSESEKLDKIIQSRVDRAMAEERKKSADLQKQLDKMKKEKLTKEELEKIEAEERDQKLADREKAVTEKENRLFAIKEIKAAGLDDGSDTALDLIDLVVSGSNDTEETISTKVKTVSGLVKKMVAAEVDKRFKANGRIPNGANVSDKNETGNIAAKLGKEKAEQNKKTNDVLSHYIGGKK